ncbi:hypothetical protein C7G97_17680 [Acinetobacter nosocomialis]|nr:hypothetical protein C7G97_17680 [Acinetobacter nosocomialis]
MYKTRDEDKEAKMEQSMKIISINQSVKIHTSCSSILLMIFLLLVRDSSNTILSFYLNPVS